MSNVVVHPQPALPAGTYRIRSYAQANVYLDLNPDDNVNSASTNADDQGQTWKVTPAADGTYKIVNPGISSVLEIRTFKDKPNQFFLGGGTSDMTWTIETRGDAWIIGVPNNCQAVDLSEGKWIILWERNGLPKQRWIFEPISVQPVAPPAPVASPSFGSTDTGNAFADLPSTPAPKSIKQISVFSGWVVDGISVTYCLADGTDKIVRHGMYPCPPNEHVIKIEANEVLQSASGKAGYHSYYKTALVNQITFVVKNTATGATRTAGPFGNSDHTNQGNDFQFIGPIVGFGGRSVDGPDALGIKAISFFK